MLVRDVMNREVARIDATATFVDATRRLRKVGWSELAVTDPDGTFVGVLAVGDVLRALLPDLDELVRQGASMEMAFHAFLEMGRDFGDQPVTRLVIRDPMVVAPADPLLRVATVMIARHIHRMFVVDDGKLVGTVGSRRPVSRRARLLTQSSQRAMRLSCHTAATRVCSSSTIDGTERSRSTNSAPARFTTSCSCASKRSNPSRTTSFSAAR